MNRSLIFPGFFCLIAFVALLATIHGANDRQTSLESTEHVAVGLHADRLDIPVPMTSTRPLSNEAARKRVASLTDEYLRPWRQWESSPRHLYSRAAPRPIPTITAEIAMVPTAKGQSDAFLLGTIAITTGTRTQPVPCIVDRTTKRIWTCVDGRWLTEDEWLRNAPSP